LWRKCRYVSRKWKALATTVLCQERSIKLRVLKLVSDRYHPSEILELCREIKTMPWSVCEIKLKFHKSHEFLKTTTVDEDLSMHYKNMAILEAVWSQIKELILAVDDYEVVIANLHKIPNVEKLIISAGRSSEPLILPIPTSEQEPNFRLLKLKELKIKTSIMGGSECFQHIYRSSPQLRSVNLRCPDFSTDELEQLAPLLATIPSIALKFDYSGSSKSSLEFLMNANCNNVSKLRVFVSWPLQDVPPLLSSLGTFP